MPSMLLRKLRGLSYRAPSPPTSTNLAKRQPAPSTAAVIKLPHPAIVAATTAAPIQRRNTGAQHQQPPESGASTGEHPNTPAPRLATPTTIGTNNNHGCYSSSHNYNTNNRGKHPGNQRARTPATGVSTRAVTPANRPRSGGTNRKSGNQHRQHQQPG
ncbi:PREDICTED: uncharacterized protein LOC108359243 [Rhagoletis zephyria]|uniref:uncharacterized protein LOC108359243 n=1 Tax=Rhagoletis zephyria TaxID=28612 RepID=UPI00081182FF|nr:PREDICTED: uncharacterized protein LOC108359243 [Rhagoletis zephyria]